MPALPLAVALYLAFATLLVMQPDVGQTLLVSMVWCALFFLSGQPLVWAGAIRAAWRGRRWALPTARSATCKSRIDRFCPGSPGDNSQIDRAMQSFAEGGFLGRGPGEGTIKTRAARRPHRFHLRGRRRGVWRRWPASALLALFAFIVLRALARTVGEPDAFTRLPSSALALLFGLQALINMGVNVGLLPAKGMTLPFISAGGSSMLAVALTCGMLLALTRRRPTRRA